MNRAKKASPRPKLPMDSNNTLEQTKVINAFSPKISEFIVNLANGTVDATKETRVMGVDLDAEESRY
jgi:hypothetical protein